MILHRIDLLDTQDERVSRFKEKLFDNETTAHIGAIFFGGDRYDPVEVVAMLSIQEGEWEDCGLATLAPTDEMGQGGSHIIALWTNKKKNMFLNCSVEMLQALAEEAVKRYGEKPTFIPATQYERLIALRAKDQGIGLHILEVKGNLPDW